MEIHKIVHLLKSSVLEDTQIGLVVLLNNYTEEQIIDIFDEYGEVWIDLKGNPDYYTPSVFYRSDNAKLPWKTLYRDNLVFFVGSKVLFYRDPEGVYRIWKGYNPEEI